MRMTIDLAIERPDTWTLLCEHHAPYFRALSDPTYLPWVRHEIEVIKNKLAGMLSFEDIVQRMDNGYDMLQRGKIDADRFHSRFAELEGLRRKRLDLEDNLEYWQKVLRYATAATLEPNEDDNDD